MNSWAHKFKFCNYIGIVNLEIRKSSYMYFYSSCNCADELCITIKFWLSFPFMRNIWRMYVTDRWGNEYDAERLFYTACVTSCTIYNNDPSIRGADLWLFLIGAKMSTYDSMSCVYIQYSNSFFKVIYVSKLTRPCSSLMLLNVPSMLARHNAGTK